MESGVAAWLGYFNDVSDADLVKTITKIRKCNNEMKPK
jgi:hypothetical protein